MSGPDRSLTEIAPASGGQKRSHIQNDSPAGDGPALKRSNMTTTDDAVQIKVLIPTMAVGAIIGKGGEAMRSLKHDSGCKVQMSKNQDIYPGTNERMCLVRGKISSVMKVLEKIAETISDKISKDCPPDQFDHKGIDRNKEMKMVVPNTSAGMVIGKAGTRIKEIREATGANIQVYPKQGSQEAKVSQERVVTIAGEPPRVLLDACSRVLEKIAADPLLLMAFDPNSSKYRGCCCHVKVCVTVWLCIEVFLIFCSLISLITTYNQGCEAMRQINNESNQISWSEVFRMSSWNGTNGTSAANQSSAATDEFTRSYKKVMSMYTDIYCGMKWYYLVMILLELFIIALALYGISKEKAGLLLPVLIWKGLALVMMAVTVVVVLIGGFVAVTAFGLHWAVLLVILVWLLLVALFCLIPIYIFMCILRCYQYIKNVNLMAYQGQTQMVTMYPSVPAPVYDYKSPQTEQPPPYDSKN